MTTNTTPGPGILQLSGIIVDLVYRVDTVPKAGEEAVVHGFEIAPGGGFNAMLAAKRALATVAYGGGIGDGPLGRMAAEALAAHDIEQVRSVVQGQDQGCSTVLIDKTAERTLIAREGAEGHLGVADLDWIEARHERFWLLSGYQLSYAQSRRALANWLQALPDQVPLVFDPSPAHRLIPKDALASVLNKALWISANAVEAEALSGKADPARAAQCLVAGRQRADGGVIVRAADQGCYLASAGCPVRHVPGHRVHAIDTNGAGDSHIGSFLAALLRFGDVERALCYANIAAALSTTRRGPATAPDFATVMRILDQR